LHLPVAHALLAPRDLDELALDLRLALCDPLLDLRDLDPSVLHLALDLGANPDGELARLHLGLAPDRLGLPLGIGDDARPVALGAAEPAPARVPQPRGRRTAPDHETDEHRDDREHACPPEWTRLPARLLPRGCSHPARARRTPRLRALQTCP
jgi:hypothetical protein